MKTLAKWLIKIFKIFKILDQSHCNAAAFKPIPPKQPPKQRVVINVIKDGGIRHLPYKALEDK